jgi:enoyl-CoA hydratase/carnithine racemase
MENLFEGKRASLQADGPVATLSLFNPGSGCMDEAMEAELLAALDLIDAAPALRAVVVTGRDEGVFVRHYDVAVLERRGRRMRDKGIRFSADQPPPESAVHRCLSRIASSPRIYIAAINGTCMGGGYELALACDLRYAQHGDYPIGLPEVNLGLLPGAGGTQRLPELVGQSRALEWLLLGRTFGPDQAAAHGLVHLAVPAVRAHALAIAAEISARPADALAHIKRLVRRPDPERGPALERALFCDLLAGDAALERMAAFNAGLRRITD